MNAIDKTVPTDISLGHLLDVLAVAPDAPLVFSYGGTPVRPGYDVTEVPFPLARRTASRGIGGWWTSRPNRLAAVNQMDQVTQQNAAKVEETSAATYKLSAEAGSLSELVGRFKIGKTSNLAIVAPLADARQPQVRVA